MYRIKEPASPHIKEFLTQMRIRGMSEKTQCGYVESIEHFFKFYKGRKPKTLTIGDINEYQHHLCHKRKHAPAYVNSQTASIKFFFRYVLQRDWDWRLIPYMKDQRKLPVVMNRAEIERLLTCATNIKHRAMLTTLYATGMRPIELTKLKAADINTKEKVIHVRHGKGSKDRFVMLSERLLVLLRQYWKEAHPSKDGYLFEGEKRGTRMNVDSVSAVFRRVKPKAQVRQDAYCYALRHSFATHLLEDGVDIRVIQKLMGHADIATTVRYLQVAKEFVARVASPLDRLAERR